MVAACIGHYGGGMTKVMSKFRMELVINIFLFIVIIDVSNFPLSHVLSLLLLQTPW